MGLECFLSYNPKEVNHKPGTRCAVEHGLGENALNPLKRQALNPNPGQSPESQAVLQRVDHAQDLACKVGLHSTGL